MASWPRNPQLGRAGGRGRRERTWLRTGKPWHDAASPRGARCLMAQPDAARASRREKGRAHQARATAPSPRCAAPGLRLRGDAESQAAKARCWEAKERGSYLGNLIQGRARLVLLFSPSPGPAQGKRAQLRASQGHRLRVLSAPLGAPSSNSEGAAGAGFSHVLPSRASLTPRYSRYPTVLLQTGPEERSPSPSCPLCRRTAGR